MADSKHSSPAPARIPLQDDWNGIAGELLLAMLALQDAQKRLTKARRNTPQ
jgi:hypothetical protein